ncbi:hypothetical protein DRN52_01495 [Thermococci archaeon]|nr:MAG: hypothetical protein DRN52_01495 [Thermococci archaeon]
MSRSGIYAVVVVAIVVLVVSSGIYFGLFREKAEEKEVPPKSESTPSKEVGAEEATNKVLEYMNSYLKTQGVEAKLVGVEEYKGLYRLKIDVNGRVFEVYSTKDGSLMFDKASPIPISGEGLSKEEIANKTIDYINSVLKEQGMPEIKLVGVEEYKGLYRLKIDIGQGRVVESYVTKDGSVFFPQAYDTSQLYEGFDAPDSEVVNVKFFVMSFCPYGNIAEEALMPVYQLLGEEKVEWEPHYVIYGKRYCEILVQRGNVPDMDSCRENYCIAKDEETWYCSMHGIQELNQDVRELCVWKYYPHDVWWKFVKEVNQSCNSRNADTCWEQIAEKLGINLEQVKKCQAEEAISLLEGETSLNSKYNVRGSPTVFINDKVYRGERTPEAYKNAICSGFKVPPKECGETLSGGGKSPRGSCGG